MSLHYIVDGYNVLLRSGLFDRRRLQDARADFLSYVRCLGPQGSARNRLTIVFDGRADIAGFEGGMGLDVIFTSGETADDKIKEMVERSSQPKNIVVVTDDKELGLFARRCGARWAGCKDFFGKIGPKGRLLSSDGPGVIEREKITEELRRVWLKKR